MNIIMLIITTLTLAIPVQAQEHVTIPVLREGDSYYFTHYDLVESQTDKSPCRGASGKDLCALRDKGIPTMAITVDVRRKIGIKLGDIVRLIGDPGCAGTYQVHDEMACRYRGEYAGKNCINKKTGKRYSGRVARKGHWIKGDVVGRPGGVCKIKLLK